MKTTATVFVMVLIFSTMHSGESRDRGCFAEVAKYAEANTVKALRGYLASLNSDNDGVKESTLAHVAMMKLAANAVVGSAVRAKVNEIALNASTNELRYKAFLVTAVIENPEVFRGIEQNAYATADELFGALASRLGEFYATR